MEPQGRILDGNLETLGLQSTLKMLSLSGKTGTLTVTSGQEKLAISLENGQIVDLEEPGVHQPNIIDMFRLLRRLQHLPRPQIEELREQAGANPNWAMILMMRLGVVTSNEQQQRMEFRIIQAICRAVRWERGRFEFHRNVAHMNGRMGMQKPLDMDHVLLEAIRMADEWSYAGSATLSRNTMARWMPNPAFDGDVTGLNLSTHDLNVLCLSNGQFPLHAISYALLLPEPQAATIMQHLLELGLIEVVDPGLERELERSLTNLLTQSQHMLSQDTRPSPERRMLTLIRTMGNCINGLLAHHGAYARALRGRGEAPRTEVNRYLRATFNPLLVNLQRDYPRMEDIVRLEGDQLNFRDVETLDKVVRGQELTECYWDALQLFSRLMRLVFDRVIADEVGKSRAGRQYEDLWSAFLRETDDEIGRQFHRRVAQHVQAERGGAGRSASTPRQPEPFDDAVAAAYQFAPDTQRRYR